MFFKNISVLVFFFLPQNLRIFFLILLFYCYHAYKLLINRLLRVVTTNVLVATKPSFM